MTESACRSLVAVGPYERQSLYSSVFFFVEYLCTSISVIFSLIKMRSNRKRIFAVVAIVSLGKFQFSSSNE